MPAPTPVDYERLVAIFRDVADRHNGIRDFGTGEAYDITNTPDRIGTSGTDGNGAYPLLWLERHHFVETTQRTRNYRVAFYMITNAPGPQPGQDAEVSALSAMLNMSDDVITMIRYDYQGEVFAVSPDNTPVEHIDVTNITTDNTYGWRCEITIETVRPPRCPIDAEPRS